MPKTSKARRQRRSGNSVQGTGKASQPRTERVTKADKSAVGAINRPLQSPFFSPSVRGPESLIFPAMVALGCWGIVIYFLFLTSEANHILFGGMAVLMALLWTFSFGTRVRKLLQQRSRM
ncbi:MAG TPA: hypothetical protein VFN02_14810 [Ktedonobacteraceae bacterium]|nr:hypothetical protein [Ktedonobacteraceae bacterium]